MDYEISYAKKSEELALKRLFLNCFDDTLGFVNMFFAHHFVPENTLCVRMDNKIIGQAQMLSCSVAGKKCYYAYAICVDSEYRGQGIGRAMLEFIKRESDKQGFGVLLRPQDEDVIDFYKKCGFYPCGRINKEYITPAGAPAELYPVSAAEYKAIRDDRFSENKLCWDSDSVDYALSQETFFGFTAAKTDSGDIVLYGMSDGECYIKETTARGEHKERVAAAVAKKMGAEEVAVLSPANYGEIVGLGYNVPSDIYMNLLLD